MDACLLFCTNLMVEEEEELSPLVRSSGLSCTLFVCKLRA